MAKYVFSSILDPFINAYNQVKDSGLSEDAKKLHDIKVLQSLVPSFREVQEYYKEYVKLLAECKAQAKSSMDAIENTLKKCHGKPGEAELKLLRGSQETIDGCVQALDEQHEHIKSELLDWRGGWPDKCRKATFYHEHMKAMTDYRGEMIAKQTSEWNPQVERIMQYAVRAKTLIDAAAVAGKQAVRDSANELLELTKKHTDCMAVGAKPVGTYIQTVTAEVVKMRKEAKDGLTADGKKTAAAVWKLKAEKYEQYAAYAKTFSGAAKTLDILKAAVATAAKAADKSSESKWKELKTAIDADIKSVAQAEKDCAECIKLGAKIKEMYQKAIAGK